MAKRRAHFVLSTRWDREWHATFQDFRSHLVQLLHRVTDALEDGSQQGPFQTDGPRIRRRAIQRLEQDDERWNLVHTCFDDSLEEMKDQVDRIEMIVEGELREPLPRPLDETICTIPEIHESAARSDGTADLSGSSPRRIACQALTG